MDQKRGTNGKSPQLRRLEATTWYGLPVKIMVSSDNLHWVSVPGLAIPHPGLVNLIARQGLPLDLRLDLTSRHELGHLQTLPVPLLHLLILLWPRRGHPVGPRLLRWLVLLLTNQAVWELAAEGYVLATDKRAVRAQRSSLARGLYAGFWGSLIVIAVMGTRFLLQRNRDNL
jgi:hypothetical protein